jgi:pilus assembly protein Flp/PilA
MLLTYLRARFAREEGQALVEYALILSLIAVAAVVILKTMGDQISGIFSTISSGL